MGGGAFPPFSEDLSFQKTSAYGAQLIRRLELGPALAAAIGLVLAVAGWQGTIGHWPTALGYERYRDANEGRASWKDWDVPMLDLFQRAGERTNSGREFVLAGFAALKAAERLGPFSAEGRQMLERADSLTRRGVRRSPVQPEAWTALARIGMLLGRPGETVANSLTMAYYTGANVREILFPRLELALLYWRNLDDDTRPFVRNQFKRSLEDSPDTLVASIRRADLWPQAALMLSDDPKTFSRFSARYCQAYGSAAVCADPSAPGSPH